MAYNKSICEWEAEFKKYDKDGSQTLNVCELRDMFHGNDLKFPDSKVADAFILIDDGGPVGDRRISLKEFSAGMANLQPTIQKAIEHFAAIDKDHNDCLSKEEMTQLLKGSRPDKSDDEIEALLSQVDTSGDGQLSFVEFLGAYIV